MWDTGLWCSPVGGTTGSRESCETFGLITRAKDKTAPVIEIACTSQTAADVVSLTRKGGGRLKCSFLPAGATFFFVASKYITIGGAGKWMARDCC